MVQQFQRYLPTAFDEGMTLLEKVNKVIITLNQIGKLSNDVLDQWNQVMDWVMADGMDAAISSKLDSMVTDGTLDKIINQDILSGKADTVTMNQAIADLTTFVNGQVTSLQNFVNGKGINLESFAIQTGETDDTARLQRAIDSLPNGGMIYVTKDISIGDLTISKNNVVLYLLNTTLKTTHLELQGNNCGIMGVNGVISGYLKVQKLTSDLTSGSSTLTFSTGHPFVVGDKIMSSYGLYNIVNGGTTPIQVTGTTATTVTVANNAIALVPSGAYVGTFQWQSTVLMSGSNTFVKDVSILNANGYPLEMINKTGKVENVVLDQCGLDVSRIADGVTAYLKNVYFGYSYDPAKQAMAVTNDAIVTLENCTFNHDNSDVDIYLFGNHTKTKIKAINCSFSGGRTNPHPAPYNTIEPSVISLSTVAGATIDTIELIGCTFSDYRQGVIHRPQIAEFNNTMYVGKIRIVDCKYIRSLIGFMVNAYCSNYKMINCVIDPQNAYNTDYELVSGWANCTLELYGCEIKNVSSNFNLNYFRLDRCKFKDNVKVNIEWNTVGYDNEFDNTPITSSPTYDGMRELRLYRSILKFTPNSNFTTYVSLGYNMTMEFVMGKGSLKGLFINNGGTMQYLLYLNAPNGFVNGLYGDDWMIPLNSQIYDPFSSEPTKIRNTTKYGTTILSGGVSQGATTANLAGVFDFAVGDYLNFVLDDGRVFTTKITALNGNTVTLGDAFPSPSSNGNGVCNFLF
jgi:hypothetical protein